MRVITVLGYSADGRIVGWSTGPETERAELEAGLEGAERYLDVEDRDWLDHWVETNVRPHALRRCVDPGITRDGLAIRGIPTPALVRVNGVGYAVPAGGVELEFDEAGAHWVTVECEHPKYREWSDEVVV